MKFLTTLPDKITAAYGQRVLEGLRELFHIIHRRDKMDPARFQRALEKARDKLIAVGQRASQRSEAQNLAEQAIRFVVLDRLVTQGTRSERDRRWCERIWTAIATCTQQGRSVFHFLRDALYAHLRGEPAPSLLPAGP